MDLINDVKYFILKGNLEEKDYYDRTPLMFGNLI